MTFDLHKNRLIIFLQTSSAASDTLVLQNLEVLLKRARLDFEKNNIV